jgi:hypothetical protein
LGSKTLKVADWHYQAIHAGIGGGVGGTHLYRFAGSARDLDETVRWTLILKILNAQSDADSASSHYWRREAEAYRSGLLDELPSDLAAPRCFGVIEYANESCWLWLEDVIDDIGRWPLERYGLAAYHLGRFNGQFVTTRRLPTWPWLSASWIRSDIKVFGAEVGRLRDNLGRPLMRRFLPGDGAELLLRLWAEHETFMAALDGLPQTLCHFDAFRRNLFAKSAAGGDHTILIDWAFLGTGPIGAEIVSLVLLTLIFREVPELQARDLDGVAFEGYLRGLRDAGWQGESRQVRLGYTAAMALRRLAIIGYMLPEILGQDPHPRPRMEDVFGMPIDECGDHVARIGQFVETLAQEARDLISPA